MPLCAPWTPFFSATPSRRRGFPGGRQVTPVTAGRSIATLICLRHTLRLMEPLADALEVIGRSVLDMICYGRTTLVQPGSGLILPRFSLLTTLMTFSISGFVPEVKRHRARCRKVGNQTAAVSSIVVSWRRVALVQQRASTYSLAVMGARRCPLCSFAALLNACLPPNDLILRFGAPEGRNERQ